MAAGAGRGNKPRSGNKAKAHLPTVGAERLLDQQLARPVAPRPPGPRPASRSWPGADMRLLPRQEEP